MANQNGNAPLDKNNKYDRQLRLWGDHGQTALEVARVCLINASATGTEILKNLILPGIGSFTIVDGNKVQGEDIGNNFFLTKDSLGKPRAQVTTELLSELNPDVNGDFVEEHTENLLKSNPAFFSTFSIVVATNLHENVLLELGRLLWEKNIPLLVCRCYGFIGYMRLVVKEHTVIESHPDSVHEDLRLDRPFSGLQNLCDSYNLSSMNKKDHSHTPWLILIYKYLQQWKQEHNGESPKNYREKNQFKELIKQGILKNKDGIPEEEDNFDEAVRNVNTSLVQTSVPSEVNKLFDDPCCQHISNDSKPFWILVRALKEYVHNEGNGALPLRGAIPDMTADSERYIQLQQVYKNQAETDSALVMKKVYSIIQALGIEEPLSPDGSTETIGLQSVINCNAISENDIKTFCKNAAFLRVVRCRSLDEEYSVKSEGLQTLGNHLENEDGDDLIYYVLLRAVDKFYEQCNRYPGAYNDQMESDIRILKACVSKLLHDWNLSSNVKDDYVHEMCRFGASEIHSLSAYIGGAAAQEVIKIVTHQFLPINNTYIYNAIKQSSLTEQL